VAAGKWLRSRLAGVHPGWVPCCAVKVVGSSLSTGQRWGEVHGSADEQRGWP
jgi:hypothetical protein